ncbi:MAG: glycerophosphodiester phosphodiesterase [Ignavibacteria bacterium]|nr:glycerophosphodiester phosphodiesterase [Ignavibacteria bacterium]
MITLKDFVREEKFFVIAHRGDSGSAPENTLAAINLAIASGVKMIEIDVQLTSDKQLVVFHDSVLGRTSNGHGFVKNFTLEQLLKLDAGSWFNSSFAGEKIPMLLDVLNAARGRVYLNIEIKPAANDPSSYESIEMLIKAIEDFGMAAFVVFASFDHAVLKHIKEIKRYLHTCALNVPGDSRLPSEIVNACGADAYGCSVQELTEKRAENIRRHRIPWGVYTVNTNEDLAITLKYGVQAAVTNFPSAVMKEYSRREK